jgi:hypothetical protein
MDTDITLLNSIYQAVARTYRSTSSANQLLNSDLQAEARTHCSTDIAIKFNNSISFFEQRSSSRSEDPLLSPVIIVKSNDSISF